LKKEKNPEFVHYSITMPRYLLEQLKIEREKTGVPISRKIALTLEASK